ncbi:MAG: hypothetical protein AAF725_02090, partial [Acidobacteriota bacterium]
MSQTRDHGPPADAAETPSAETPEARLEAVESKLRQLEERWPARGGPPSIPPPEGVKDLEPWLRRLHQTVTDLARQQAELETRSSAILDLLEAADEARGAQGP